MLYSPWICKTFFSFSCVLIWSLMTVSSLFAGNVKEYGAVGDGQHDDTKAIEAAVNHCDDGVLVFPRGEYKITKPIELNLSKTGRMGIRGEGGTASIIMSGGGAAFRIIGSHNGTADPNTIRKEVWQNERMPIIQDIEIVGEHPDARGIEISNTFQIALRSVLVRNVKYGIHFTSLNRNVLIESCHVYDCSEIGIFLDRVNIHQMNINNSHISYNDRSGIKVEGGQIRNFQITGNDIEYNYALDGKQSADIWIDNSMEGSSVREGSITGNTIQAIISDSGCNILFEGQKEAPNKIGLWSITGNHISNQAFNIHLKYVRGISISGNTFIRGSERHILIENSRNITLGTNIFDRNLDYFDGKADHKGGVRIENSENIIFDNLILEGIHQQGAIEVVKGNEVSISNCQIKNPKQHGIYLEDSKQVIINGCLISGDKDSFQNSTAGIYLNALSNGILISNNMFKLGKDINMVNQKESKEILMNGNIRIQDN